jgi:hypothetical protein
MSHKQYYQMIQFKILHRILNVKEYLMICNIEPSNICRFCNEPESIHHAFISCPFNYNFLNQCKKWLDNLTKICFPMSDEEFLFLIRNENNDNILDIYNRFIFHARIFMWKRRCLNATPALLDFLKFLYDEIYYELCVYKSKNVNFSQRTLDRWGALVDESNVLNQYLFQFQVICYSFVKQVILFYCLL